MFVRDRISEPRPIQSRLRRLCARRSVMTRLESLSGSLGLWIRGICLGRQRWSLLLAYGLEECIDDRRVPRDVGSDLRTPDPLQTSHHWRLVWILRSAELARWRMDSLCDLAGAVARIGGADSRQACPAS